MATDLLLKTKTSGSIVDQSELTQRELVFGNTEKTLIVKDSASTIKIYPYLDDAVSSAYNVWSGSKVQGEIDDITGGTTKVGDSELLDGLNSTQFIRSDVDDVVTSNTRWNDNYKIGLGTDNDMRLYHDNSNAHINIHTGSLYIQAYTGSYENMIIATPSSSVDLYYDNSLKFSTTTYGAQVSHNFNIFGTDANPGGGLSMNYDTTSTQFWLGTTSDTELSIGRVGATNGVGSIRIHSTGQVELYDWSNTKSMLSATIGAEVELYYDGNLKLETKTSGISVTGNVDPSGDIHIVDNKYVYLGNSNDLRIYHDGTNNFISSNNGELRLYNIADTEPMIRCVPDGAVLLYYDGNEKLSTTATGVDITGNLNIDHTLQINNTTSSADIFLYESGTNYTLIQRDTEGVSVGEFLIRNKVNNTDYDLLMSASGLLTWDGNTIYHSGNMGSSSGADSDTVDGLHAASFIRSNASDTVTGTTTWNDSHQARFGTSGDLRIYHSGAENHIDTYGGWPLIIYNATDSENMIHCRPNSSVSLYYNGRQTFYTNSYGINIISNSIQGPELIIHDGRNSTWDSGDEFGKIRFHTSDSSSSGTQARIFTRHDRGGTGHNNSDASLVFSTHTGLSPSSVQNDALIINNNQQILGKTGTNSSPTFSFMGDADTGFYRVTANQIGFTIGGIGYGNWNSYRLQLIDNYRLDLGTSNDMRIYHNGSHNYIDIYNGQTLYIRNASNTENMIECNSNTTVKLYYNGNARLVTHTNGIQITGPSDTHIYMTGIGQFASNTDAHFRFYNSILTNYLGIESNASYTYFAHNQADPSVNYFMAGDSLGNVIFKNRIYFPNGTEAAPSITFLNDTDTGLYWDAANHIRFSFGGTSYASMNTNRLHFVDNYSLDLGTNQDLRMYHSGSHNYISSYNGEIRLYNALNSEHMIRCIPNNSVELYYNGVLKLNTTSTGIYVSGTILAGTGTVALPSYSFSSDTNTGMYLIEADNVGISTVGIRRMDINSSGIFLGSGRRVNEFSSDVLLSGNSNTVVPTEQAVKTYTDGVISSHNHNSLYLGISANAVSATKLVTARTINGVSFDGTGNITVEPYISNDDTGDTNCPIIFSANSTAGYKRLYEDSALYFDNTNNRLYSSYFYGALVGNVTGNISGSSGSFTGSLNGDVTGTQGATVVGNNSHTHTGSTISALDGTDITTGTIADARLPATISSNITGSSASCTGNASTSTNATNASKLYINNDDTGDTNCPILFTATTTAGNKSIYEDSALYFDNTNNRLYSSYFYGALVGNVTGNVSGSSGSCTGNAATATNATNATNASKLYIDNYDTGDTNCPILFTATTTAGNKSIYEDSALYFDTNNNRLYSSYFYGNVRTPNGTEALPAYSFWGDINTGMYWVSTDNLGFSTLGVRRMDVSDSGLYLGSGQRVNEFSSDGALTSDSNSKVPTEQAVKTYVDDYGGISQTTADGLYLNESSNLQDLTDVSTARGSLGLAGTDVTTHGHSSTHSLTSHDHNSSYFTEAESDARYGRISSGINMLFGNGSVPTGWVKITSWATNANIILSGVGGSGGNTGNPISWTTNIVSSPFTLAVNELPSHSHSIPIMHNFGNTHQHNSNPGYTAEAPNNGTLAAISDCITGNKGNSAAHTHGVGQSTFAPRYRTVIAGQKS